MNRFLTFAVALTVPLIFACGESSTPTGDSGPGDSSTGVPAADVPGTDVPGSDVPGTDVPGTDGGPDCPNLACEDGCRPYTRNGCLECYCPPDVECATDSECVLGNLTGMCCGGCTSAFPRSVADENACIVENYTPASSECQGVGCEKIDCPAIACAAASRAICNAGKCEASSECAEGEVMTRFGCAPTCTANSDCTVRTNTSACCTDCAAVMHTSLASSLPCFFGPDETPGPECQPDPALCEELACPDIACEEITAVACNTDSGLCEVSR